MTPPDVCSLFSRPFGRRDFLRAALAATAGGAALYTLGCGSGDDDDGATATPAGASASPGTGTTPGGTAPAPDIRPVLLTTEFVAKEENRFAVGLLKGSELVTNAAVGLRFFVVGEDGTTGTLRGEGDAEFVELNVEDAHAHDSSTGETVEEDRVAFYLARVPFDVAGRWVVETTVVPSDGSPETSVQVPVQVLEQSRTPALGSVPPASQHDTAATNPDTKSLCSREPACVLHEKVIGDVLGKGRPVVVQFSTPAFCQTRFCGPVLEVLLEQAPAYKDRVDFVHIEVWRDFQAQQQRPAVQEWGLPGEPFTFFMDGDGKLVSRLEAVFTEEELASALARLTAA